MCLSFALSPTFAMSVHLAAATDRVLIVGAGLT